MVYKKIIAQKNRSNVLNIIRNHGPINKAVIAKKVDLSIPTVMKITEEFETEKLIRTIGKGESTGGKRPDLLEFVPDAYYIIGIDIGRRQIKVVLMDMDARIIEKSAGAVIEEHVNAPEVFVADIVRQVYAILEKKSIEAKKVMGIGIGMPGIIDHCNGLVRFSPDFNWTDVSLVSLLKRDLPYPIMMENSNRTLALGEYTYGAGKDFSNMFCINIGHGIGGAMVIHGEVSHGASGSCGEIGHIVADPDGPLCDCGNRGCLEAISSGNAIAKRALAEIERRETTILDKISGKVEAKDVFDAAQQGDPLSKAIVKDAMIALGAAIASLINLLDPDVIVLAGGVAKSWDNYCDILLQTVQQHKMRYAGEKTKIKLNKLGDYGTAIGAATLLVQSFIKNGGHVLM